MISRRLLRITSSSGDTAFLSSMNLFSTASLLSAMLASSEIGSWAAFRIWVIFATGVRSSLASSWTVGSRPSRLVSSFEVFSTRFMASTMWTGIRIVRPWSAIARVMLWRIHQVA